MVAIAGPPGAGKSTLSQALCSGLNGGAGDGPATVVPMDGFHLDNAILEARGLLPRKGAPETFDVDGFEAVLRRIRRKRREVAIPLFDRRLDLARAGGAVVAPRHRIVLVEGNYLLVDRPPWDRLAGLFDLTIFLDVPHAELERRLVQRWLDHGHTPAAARRRALANDVPNADFVVAFSRPADVRLAG